MAILDTNVLVRYLTDDNVDLSPRAYAVLRSIEDGQRTAVLPEGVLIEVVQVLMGETYQVPRATVRERLRAVLTMPGIEMANKRGYLDALDVFVEYTRLSIVDSICVAHARREKDATVITFDRGFRNLPSVNWEQP